MFGRKNDSASTDPARARQGDGAAATSGKGRPTPKRKESEAARRQNMSPPKDRREAKSRMKAEKAKERQRTTDALRGGDERHYPARDQGKARHLARNWIDGRRNIGELFWPVVIAALVLLFLPIPPLQQGSTVVLLGFYVVDHHRLRAVSARPEARPAARAPRPGSPPRSPGLRLRTLDPVAQAPAAGPAGRAGMDPPVQPRRGQGLHP